MLYLCLWCKKFTDTIHLGLHSAYLIFSAFFFSIKVLVFLVIVIKFSSHQFFFPFFSFYLSFAMISCTRYCTANLSVLIFSLGRRRCRFPDPYLIKKHTGLRTRQGEPHPLLFADTENGLRRIFFKRCVRACEACVRAREATEISACAHC